MTNQSIRTSSEIPTDVGEHDLLQLISIVNDELEAGLHVQDDEDTPAHVIKNDKHEDLGRHICFELAGQQWAIPLSAVLEVGELQLVQPLPLLPDWLSGITTIRGEIFSVVNLARFLDRNNKSSASVRAFLLVYNETITIVLTVDRVIGTRTLSRLFMEQSEQDSEVISSDDFRAGRAHYNEDGTERAIDLFDMSGFLSSQKLRNLASV